MSDAVPAEGTIVEILPNTMFRVKLDVNKEIVLGHLSGRMRKNYIKCVLGDKVVIELSPYDMSRGRITQRF